MNYQRFSIVFIFAAVLLLSNCASQPAPPAADAPRAEQTQPATPATQAAGEAPAEAAPAPAQPDLPEPCAVLTRADLAAVLTEPFSEGEAGEQPVAADAAFIPRDCTFRSGDKLLVLTLFPDSGPYQAQKESPLSTQAPQGVAGLGDEAFWDHDTNELWVVQGRVTVALGFVFMEASPDIAAPLAQKVLSRLQ
jgi:hypothetical protein